MKIAIKKTKMNIFWLLVLGLLIGLVFGLRRPMPAVEQAKSVTQEVVK